MIAVACVQLIFTSFSSIQQALYRREFEFKVLFIVRLISIFVPFTVTLPLALLGFGYWSLIISSILIRFINAVILTMKSEWKPRFYYDIEVLKEMFSFSAWSLVEAITIWLTSWADAFVIGNTLSQYYLGLYKTSTNMVNNLLNLIKASVVPVLFSTLSRLQNDVIVFNNTFFRFQRIVSILVFPIGFGVYLYSDIATNILLGDQWKEASNVIGIWALTSSLMIVYGHFSSEIYRAKGRPKLSVLAQLLHLIVLIPTIIITAKYGFWILVLARSLVRFQLLIVHLLILKYFLDFPIKKLFTNVTEPLLASCIMVLSATYLKQISTGIIWSTVSIIICALIYFVILYLLPRTKVDINWIIKNLLPKNDSVINPNK